MIPVAVADSWFFWLAIIDGLAAVYILPTVIGIARQVEGLGPGHLPEHDPARLARGAAPRVHDAAQTDPVASCARQDTGARCP